MKRRVLLIIVFLFLGAIVNVAVAWGLSLRSWPYEQQFGFAEAHQPSQHLLNWWLRYAPSDFPTPAKMYTLQRFGYRSRAAHDKEVWNDSYFFAYGRAHGWPFICLEQQNWVKRALSDQYRALHLGCWPWSPQRPLELPIVPLWRGFTINTIFYAVNLWMIVAFAFVLRRNRRLKRGLCPKCAYPIGVSPVCTECGAAVRQVEPRA